MKIQAEKIEITFTQEEKNTINKFFGGIVRNIYLNDCVNLNVNKICEKIGQYFFDEMPDKMIIE